MSAPENLSLDDPETFDAGHVLGGRYEVLDLLGKGGFGAVYLALHQELHREVAVKVLLPQLAKNGEVVARFIREGRAAAAIGHPGIVEVFDLGSDESSVYLAMEKLDGEELHDRIERESPLPVSYVAGVGMEIADAVHAAHEIGVIHRDLKPQNIFLAKHGRRGAEVVKVLDFGIAKLMEAEGQGPNVNLTRTGQVFGTPLYMSPEQLRGAKDLDVRADVYAIGTILYEALTGRAPFDGATFAELVLRISMQSPTPIEALRPDVPVEMAKVVRRAMARDREERFADAGALYDALIPFRNHAPMAPSPTAFAETMDSSRDLLEGTAIEEPDLEMSEREESLAPAAPQPSRRARLAASLALLLIAIGAVAFTVAGEPAPRGAVGAPGASVQETEAVVANEVVPNDIRGAEEVPNGVAPPAPPTTRLVRIQTEPGSVRVFLDDAELCTTPCETELDGAAELTFRRSGYRNAEQIVGAEESLVEVRLLPRVRRPTPMRDDGASHAPPLKSR